MRQLWVYHQLLRQHNPELNLTRVHNFTNMVLKLYVDSILPGQLMELPSPLLDLGTGPGMPGVPLKIAYPQLRDLVRREPSEKSDFPANGPGSLKLKGLEIIGEKITPDFQNTMAGVITRALEGIASTLDRISGMSGERGSGDFHERAELRPGNSRGNAAFRAANTGCCKTVPTTFPILPTSAGWWSFSGLVSRSGSRRCRQ